MDEIVSQLEPFQKKFKGVVAELNKVIVGNHREIESLLVSLFSGGHVMLTGVPGLGRTLLAKTLATVLGLTYNRIQFTPDLLPSDILGSEILEKNDQGLRNFRFFKGPIFSNLLLADEVNRSPARTQAALLEAMSEKQVTTGGQTYWLPKPFFVLATRNNMETEGVWRMPEAQLDRFMVSIELKYLGEEDEVELLKRTTGGDMGDVVPVLTPDEILKMQKLAALVPVVPAMKRFALDIVRGSRPETDSTNKIKDWVRMGASPRAAQSILRGAKVWALVAGRPYVATEDIKAMTYPVLEHRLALDFKASSSGITVNRVIDELITWADENRLPKNAYTFNSRHILKSLFGKTDKPMLTEAQSKAARKLLEVPAGKAK